jgi:hypothetical protein
MLITDLPYFEAKAKHDTIVGGAFLGVTAEAAAYGDSSYALTLTDTNLRVVGNGKVTIGKGQASALAYGEDPYAYVDYQAQGFSKTIVQHRSGNSGKSASANLRVIALKLPR